MAFDKFLIISNKNIGFPLKFYHGFVNSIIFLSFEVYLQPLNLCIVRIVASHFANCWVNLVIAIIKLWITWKIWNSLFPKENLIHPHYIFPHYIHIISTFYLSIAYYYQMRYCLAQNCKMQKMLHISYTKILASSGLKALLHLIYILRSEFQMIILMLHWNLLDFQCMLKFGIQMQNIFIQMPHFH